MKLWNWDVHKSLTQNLVLQEVNTYGWDLALPCLSEKWGKGFRCLNTDVWTILDASTFIPEVQWFLMVSGHNYQTDNVVSEEREQQDLTLKLASE